MLVMWVKVGWAQRSFVNATLFTMSMCPTTASVWVSAGKLISRR